MIYKNKTKILGIPVHGLGDRIIPEVELQRFQIIENMLIAGTQGVKNCVFDDGLFSIDPETENTFIVTLKATGCSPSASGLVGGAYFFGSPVLSWKNLNRGYVYHLYLRGLNKTFEDPSSIAEVSSLYPIEGDNVLIAIADCRADVPKINTNPDGKVYSCDLAAHINDVENPHGRSVIQDKLYVREKICLYSPEGKGAEVEILVDGVAKQIPVNLLPGAALELAGRKVVTIDFLSLGSAGKIIEIPDINKVLFVQVSRRFSDNMDKVLGETMIGYYSEDPSLHLPSEFSVYNSGDSDIPLRALAYCW
jgi:hypothetical protein